MMSLDQLLLFLTLTCFVSASPGPVMLSCMANGGHYGLGKSAYGMAGASVGNLILMLLSALGLGLLLSEARLVFTMIKWVGAAYLVYLGAQTFFKPVNDAADSHMQFTSSTRGLFLKSIGVAVSNPKGVIYFGALFPQFITPEKPLVTQFATLTLIFLSLDLVWMVIYAKGGSYIVGWLKTPRHHQLFNRLSGSALIAVGVLLGLSENQQ